MKNLSYQRLSHFSILLPLETLYLFFMESVDQDQPAHTCSLILIHSLRCYIDGFLSKTPTSNAVQSIKMCLRNREQLQFYEKMPISTAPRANDPTKVAFWKKKKKNEKKRKYADNQHFFPFPSMFSILKNTNFVKKKNEKNLICLLLQMLWIRTGQNSEKLTLCSKRSQVLTTHTKEKAIENIVVKNNLQQTFSFRLIKFCTILVYLFVWGFTSYQQYFSYLTATAHKLMFPGLFLTSTSPVHYPDTGGPVIVLFPLFWTPRGKATITSFKDFGLSRPGIEPTTSTQEADALTTRPSRRCIHSRDKLYHSYHTCI